MKARVRRARLLEAIDTSLLLNLPVFMACSNETADFDGASYNEDFAINHRSWLKVISPATARNMGSHDFVQVESLY